VYQRKYAGDRYPQVAQQPAVHGQNYRYQPREAAVQQHYQEHAVQRAPAPERRVQAAPQERSARPQESQAPRSAPERGPEGKGAAPEPRRERGEEKGRDKGEEHKK